MAEGVQGNIVAFRPALVKITGSIKAALMLSQLLYWAENPTAQKRDGWFYKTVEELEQETGLSRVEQLNAREALLSRGLIEAEMRGVPRRWWYRVISSASMTNSLNEKVIESLSHSMRNSFNEQPSSKRIRKSCNSASESDATVHEKVMRYTEDYQRLPETNQEISPTAPTGRPLSDDDDDLELGDDEPILIKDESYPHREEIEAEQKYWRELPDQKAAEAFFREHHRKGLSPHEITLMHKNQFGNEEGVTAFEESKNQPSRILEGQTDNGPDQGGIAQAVAGEKAPDRSLAKRRLHELKSLIDHPDNPPVWSVRALEFFSGFGSIGEAGLMASDLEQAGIDQEFARLLKIRHNLPIFERIEEL